MRKILRSCFVLNGIYQPSSTFINLLLSLPITSLQDTNALHSRSKVPSVRLLPLQRFNCFYHPLEFAVCSTDVHPENYKELWSCMWIVVSQLHDYFGIATAGTQFLDISIGIHWVSVCFQTVSRFMLYTILKSQKCNAIHLSPKCVLQKSTEFQEIDNFFVMATVACYFIPPPYLVDPHAMTVSKTY